MNGPKVILCRCRHMKLVSRERVEAVAAALAARNVAVEVVDDLCGLAAAKDPRLARWAAQGPLQVFACYARAVRWLLAWGGAAVPPGALEVVNLRRPEESDRMKELLAGRGETAAVAACEDAPPDASWLPWFPVIDRDRCVDCGQCVGYCLFGVYEKAAAGPVHVSRPRNCKTFCPACARVCPRAAILFPKHDKSPINGDVPTAENLRAEKMQTGLKDLLRGDVYETLRRREQAGIPPEEGVSLASLEAALRNRREPSPPAAAAGDSADKKVGP